MKQRGLVDTKPNTKSVSGKFDISWWCSADESKKIEANIKAWSDERLVDKTDMIGNLWQPKLEKRLNEKIGIGNITILSTTRSKPGIKGHM